MTRDEAHYLECARSCYAGLIERAASQKARNALKRELREIEQSYR